ncbi:MAG: hypothetical protein WD045_07795 [Pirellulaceae bacterium]
MLAKISACEERAYSEFHAAILTRRISLGSQEVDRGRTNGVEARVVVRLLLDDSTSVRIALIKLL